MSRTNLFALVSFLAATLGCSDSSSSVSVGPPDSATVSFDASGLDGGVSSSDSSASSEDSGTSTDASSVCSVDTGTYTVLGSSLFRTTSDLRLAQLVATIEAPGGGSLSSPVLSARTGSGELIVSSASCKLCRVDPTAMSGKKVTAELLRNDLSPIALGNTASPQQVILVESAAGNAVYSAFNTSTKVIEYGSKLTLNATGVFCNGGIQDLEGSIGNGTYDLHVLTECGDGSSGSSSALVHTTGTFTTTAPFSSAQLTHTVLAWSKNSASNYSVTRMNLEKGLFAGTTKNDVFTIGTKADFVKDTSLYQQCTLAGTYTPSFPIF